MVKKLVIWGASGHALVVADAVRSVGDFEIVGFIDNLSPWRRGESFCGAAILGGRELLSELRQSGVDEIFFVSGNGAAGLN